MQHDVFISYAREDQERVRRIAEELARRGYDLWWDPELRSGQDFRDTIEEALRTAKCVVVAWSHDSIRSRFVRDEAERGSARGVLTPVFIDPGISPPLGFGGIHTNDLSEWLDDPSRQESFDRFARDIKHLLRSPPGPQVPPAIAPAPVRAPRRVAAGMPRTWLLGIAALLLVAVLAAAYLSLEGNGATDDARPPREVATPAVDAADPADTLPILPGARTDMLAGLRCAFPGESRNPIMELTEQEVPLEYTVDTLRHVLQRMDRQRVRVVHAQSVGDTLLSRRLIVAHHTALPARPAEAFFEDGMLRASAHLLIHRDGSVTQLVPFNLAAHHAGVSEWNGVQSLNRHSLGIEMENLGMLTQRADGWYFGDAMRVPADSVERFATENGRVRGWHGYTDAQLRAFFQVSCALRRAYPTIQDLVGHEDIAPGRKVDPGPAFPMSAMRRRLFPARRGE